MEFIINNLQASGMYLATHWRSILTVLRNISIILSAIFAIATVICWYLAWKFRIKFTYQPYRGKQKMTAQHREFARHWKRVVRRMTEATPDSMRLAVIEADKLADAVLKSMELKGEHMADRLQQLTSDDLRSLDGLWRAHRLRNDLVHTPGFGLSQEDARQAMKQYEAFFKEVGVLVLPKKEEKKESASHSTGEHGKDKGGHEDVSRAGTNHGH